MKGVCVCVWCLLIEDFQSQHSLSDHQYNLNLMLIYWSLIRGCQVWSLITAFQLETDHTDHTDQLIDWLQDVWSEQLHADQYPLNRSLLMRTAAAVETLTQSKEQNVPLNSRSGCFCFFNVRLMRQLVFVIRVEDDVICLHQLQHQRDSHLSATNWFHWSHN